jgi:MGT family glycosyltransferase
MDRRLRYLFALVDSGGTVPPELAVARRLVERGHTVTVAGSALMEPEVAATGAAFRVWPTAPYRRSVRPEDDLARDWECRRPTQLIARFLDGVLATPAAAFAADVEGLAAELAPDALVCSMMALGAMVAGESSGLPVYVLMPNVFVLPAEGMPPFGLGLRPAAGRLGRLRDRALGAFVVRNWDRGLARLNEVRTARGLDPLEHLWDQVGRAYRVLVLTSEGFDFPARLPANVRYVGAELGDPVWAQPLAVPDRPEGPLVVAALSSTYQNQGATLMRVGRALGSLPVEGLITTGPAIDPADVVVPRNVRVVRSGPHGELFRRAACVVTHGGHGTVVKALAAGVPLVVLPHGRDQADNAARVAARGAGLVVRRTASPARIAAAVRRVLDDPRYRRAAQRLGGVIRDDAARGRVVVELEDLPRRADSAV